MRSGHYVAFVRQGEHLTSYNDKEVSYVSMKTNGANALTQASRLLVYMAVPPPGQQDKAVTAAACPQPLRSSCNAVEAFKSDVKTVLDIYKKGNVRDFLATLPRYRWDLPGTDLSSIVSRLHETINELVTGRINAHPCCFALWQLQGAHEQLSIVRVASSYSRGRRHSA